MKTILIAFLLCACGDNLGPHVELVPPDAAIDAVVDVRTDACVREPSGDCCTLLPDEGAARACAAATVEPGACGVMICWHADCSRTQLNFCAPSDAGVDGGA